MELTVIWQGLCLTLKDWYAAFNGRADFIGKASYNVVEFIGMKTASDSIQYNIKI